MHPRPSGQPTRGKTATNRLRQVDVFVALALPDTLRGDSPLVVDLGYGALPWTTLEMAERWRAVEPSLRVVGVEIDPVRVQAAQPCALPPITRFVLGGFNLADALDGERARVVRAYNVLRQYEEADAQPALDTIAQAIEPGGVLIEGTSTPSGAMVAFDVWRRVDGQVPLQHAALVFGTNFREPVETGDFRTILPKRLIHRAMDPRPYRFFEDWRRASAIARSHGATQPRRNWLIAAELMREHFGWPIDPRRRLTERGYLVLGSELSD